VRPCNDLLDVICWSASNSGSFISEFAEKDGQNLTPGFEENIDCKTVWMGLGAATSAEFSTQSVNRHAS
jgi:hypothetical protein